MKTLGRGLFVLAVVSLMAPVAAAADGAPSADEPVVVDQAAPDQAALSEPQEVACTSEPTTEALAGLEFGALQHCIDSGISCTSDTFCEEEVCSGCECHDSTGTCVLC